MQTNTNGAVRPILHPFCRRPLTPSQALASHLGSRRRGLLLLLACIGVVVIAMLATASGGNPSFRGDVQGILFRRGRRVQRRKMKCGLQKAGQNVLLGCAISTGIAVVRRSKILRRYLFRPIGRTVHYTWRKAQCFVRKFSPWLKRKILGIIRLYLGIGEYVVQVLGAGVSAMADAGTWKPIN